MISCSLAEDDLQRLANYCRTSARRYTQLASDSREIVAGSFTDRPTPASWMAEQFDKQAADATRLAELLEQAEAGTLTVAEADSAEDAA